MRKEIESSYMEFFRVVYRVIVNGRKLENC